jgi:hypothetical protein
MYSIEYENAFYRTECFLVFYRMDLVFYSGSKKCCEKGFPGIESHQGGDCWDVCLHISYVRGYTMYLVWIGFTLEYFLVWTKFKLLVMISFMTVTVVKPIDRWLIMTGAYYQLPQPHCPEGAFNQDNESSIFGFKHIGCATKSKQQVCWSGITQSRQSRIIQSFIGTIGCRSLH